MDVAEKCEFICDDFATHQLEESFDIVLGHTALCAILLGKKLPDLQLHRRTVKSLIL